MIRSLNIIIVSVVMNTLNFNLCYSACARAEYEIDGECCPMCGPAHPWTVIVVGNRVYKHCTEFTSTTCVPCSESSYTSQPNGLISCLLCTVCDPGQGLRVKTLCSGQSDAVCEPLEGFYCTDYRSGGCIQATEHSKCSPGEYVQIAGAADRDTVCSGCADGTFSNGSLQTCLPHSQCEAQGLTVIKSGSNSSDAECGKQHSSLVIIFSVTAGVIVVAVAIAIAVAVIVKMRHKANSQAGPDYQNAERNHSLRTVEGEPLTPSAETQRLPTSRAAVGTEGCDPAQFENDQLQDINQIR